jgi:hypothetical protein
MIGNKVFIVLSSILALSLSSPIFFIIYVNGKKKKKKTVVRDKKFSSSGKNLIYKVCYLVIVKDYLQSI